MQILFIKHNRVEISGISTVLKRDISLDIVPFVSYDELPSVLDERVYCALLIVTQRFTQDTQAYIKSLRKKKFAAPIYVIASIASPDIYKWAASFTDLNIFEASGSLNGQVIFILKSIEKQYFNKLNNSIPPFQAIVDTVPDNAAIIDLHGQILAVNNTFTTTFGLIADSFPSALDEVIPDFAYEKLMRTLNDERDQSSSVITNISTPNSGIIPVEILISEPLALNAGYLVVFRDRSEIIAIKQQAEYQNRMNEDLKLLVSTALQSDQNPLSEESFLEQSKVLFSCDQIFTFNIEWKKPSVRLIIDEANISLISKKFLSVFSNLIDMAIKQNIPTVYNFSDKNPTQTTFLTWAKTIIAIPIRTSHTVYAIVLLVYSNSYEPDNSMFGVFELFSNLLAHRFDQLDFVQTQIEAEKERKYIANSIDAVFKTQLDGTFLYVNQAFLDLLGYDAAKTIYSDVNAADLFSDKNDRVEFLNLLKNKITLRNNVARLVRCDGKEIIVLEHAHLITDPADGQQVVEGTLREISSDIDVIRVLTESHNFSDDLIENAGVIIAAVDDDQKFLVWNKKAEDVLGYAAADVLGTNILISKMFPEQTYREYAIQKLNEAIFDKSGLPIELTCHTSDGYDRILNWSIRRMTTTKHEKINLLFGTDFTDIRRLEKRVLENQKMKTIGGIVEIIATHFQEMVKSIGESVYELEQNPVDTRDDIFDQLSLKLRDSHHLIERIKSLSALSSSALGEATDADRLIENSIQILRGIIPDRIKIHYEMNGFSMVQLEESQFNQMIMNLALNSVEAIEHDGEIRVESQKVRLDEDVFLQENSATRNLYFKLSFSDTGRGMDSIEKNKMFDPFFTTSTDKSRIGLGLTLIYNMVNIAHGFIDVDSRAGQGTTIRIYLPVFEGISSLSEQSSREPGMSILVIDDQLLIRELLKDILSSEGYRVFLAEDGLAGLEMYKRHKEEIDLVILDIIMPKLNGNEVYLQLKALNSSVKVLITSGHVQPEVIQELKKRGISGYLKKPFEIRAVKKHLNNILGS